MLLVRPSDLRRAVPLALLGLVACASDVPTWAVHHASVIPSETGLAGTQSWEFFDAGWEDGRGKDSYLCVRAQEVSGEVTAALSGCPGCVVAYALAATELETDCDEPIATDPAYAEAVLTMGIGEVPGDLASLDPHPSRSLGWYLSFDGETFTPYGFAYEEGLDWEGEIGQPGWAVGQTYTLWPAYAWDIR